MIDSPYAEGNVKDLVRVIFGSVPDVMESLESPRGGVSFSISWMLRSDDLMINE